MYASAAVSLPSFFSANTVPGKFTRRNNRLRTTPTSCWESLHARKPLSIATSFRKSPVLNIAWHRSRKSGCTLSCAFCRKQLSTTGAIPRHEKNLGAKKQTRRLSKEQELLLYLGLCRPSRRNLVKRRYWPVSSSSSSRSMRCTYSNGRQSAPYHWLYRRYTMLPLVVMPDCSMYAYPLLKYMFSAASFPFSSTKHTASLLLRKKLLVLLVKTPLIPNSPSTRSKHAFKFIW
jgi:hypothetical protein